MCRKKILAVERISFMLMKTEKCINIEALSRSLNGSRRLLPSLRFHPFAIMCRHRMKGKKQFSIFLCKFSEKSFWIQWKNYSFSHLLENWIHFMKTARKSHFPPFYKNLNFTLHPLERRARKIWFYRWDLLQIFAKRQQWDCHITHIFPRAIWRKKKWKFANTIRVVNKFSLHFITFSSAVADWGSEVLFPFKREEDFWHMPRSSEPRELKY